MAPWTCIRLAKRLYGPRGTHGTRNRFLDGPVRIATEMAPRACIRLAKRLYSRRGTHGTRNRVPEQLAGIATEMAPWACIHLAKRLYGPRGTHGTCNRSPDGPARPARIATAYSALQSAFTAPEERLERMEAQNRFAERPARTDRSWFSRSAVDGFVGFVFLFLTTTKRKDNRLWPRIARR